MKLFGIEIKPEIDDPIYWLHLIGIVLIVYFLVSKFVQPMDITLSTVLLGALFVGIGDIFMHTLLGLD